MKLGMKLHYGDDAKNEQPFVTLVSKENNRLAKISDVITQESGLRPFELEFCPCKLVVIEIFSVDIDKLEDADFSVAGAVENAITEIGSILGYCVFGKLVKLCDKEDLFWAVDDVDPDLAIIMSELYGAENEFCPNNTSKKKQRISGKHDAFHISELTLKQDYTKIDGIYETIFYALKHVLFRELAMEVDCITCHIGKDISLEEISKFNGCKTMRTPHGEILRIDLADGMEIMTMEDDDSYYIYGTRLK